MIIALLFPAPHINIIMLLKNAELKWAALGTSKAGKPVDIQPSFDLTDAFDETRLEPFTSSPTFTLY